ncbi:putative calcium-binding protein CML14 [Hibiscus syriacus]|uniref:Calcium-binding protein CML14 n=1 Tax=Hibiscus syriacus TaxID=106335 RepID=A0A6A2ZSP9_HIBSY|nr:putative calcium-binding protein CML14 [Hibiscus syriacus]
MKGNGEEILPGEEFLAEASSREKKISRRGKLAGKRQLKNRKILRLLFRAKAVKDGQRSERGASILYEGGFHSLRYRRRRKDRSIGAGDLNEISGWEPHTQSQLKAIVSEEKLTVAFDFPRFLQLMAKHMKAEPFDRQLRDAFKVLDKESTGFVSVADLRHILTSIGEKLEPSEFDEWIREVDVGSDGKIRYEDFVARMVAK